MRFSYRVERLEILNLPKIEEKYQCEFYCQGLKVESEIAESNKLTGIARFTKPMSIESNMLFGILEIHLNKI